MNSTTSQASGLQGGVALAQASSEVQCLLTVLGSHLYFVRPARCSKIIGLPDDWPSGSPSGSSQLCSLGRPMRQHWMTLGP